MKNKYIPITLIFLAITFFACKKENKSPVIGTWQQNKLRIYSVDATGAIINDTTYSGNTFTNLDYAQFNSNGTCVVSSSHYYYPADEGYPKDPQNAASKATLDFTPSGTQYVLTPHTNPINFAGFVTTDTTTLVSQNSLLMHVRSHGPVAGPTLITDSYYSR